MAVLKEGFLLCNSKESSLLGINHSSSDNHVIITQNNRRIRLYNVIDQKLINEWPAKTGQSLTCPSVEVASEAEFSVIIDAQLIRTWFRDDMSVDKGVKTKLHKPAHRLFSIENSIIILYADGSIGLTSTVLYEAPDHNEEYQIVWCDAYAVFEKKYIVAVFRNQKMVVSKEYLLKTYCIDSSITTVSVETTVVTPHPDGCSPVSFCLQSAEGDLHLISLYSDGLLRRNRLTSDHNTSQRGGDCEQLCPLPVSSADCSSGLAVAAVDSTQLAVVSPANKDDQTLGVGVWDTRFGLFHSWSPLPEVKKSHFLMYMASEHLIVPCSNGIYVYPVVAKRATLVSCIGKMIPVTSPDDVDFPLEVCLSLKHLSQPSETPSRSSFNRSFAVVRKWLPHCSVDGKLKATPYVTAVIQRCCVKEKQFWPVEELMVFVESHVVTPSSCTQLCAAFAEHQEVGALLSCLSNVKELTEASIVAALSCFLSADDSKFTNPELSVNGDVDDFEDDLPPTVFSRQKADYINRALMCRYNSSVLLDALRQLKYTHVLGLIQHLEHLLYKSSVTNVGNSPDSPSLVQVLDWLSLLIDGHYAQLLLFDDLAKLHSKLHSALQLKRQDIEVLSEINKSLSQIMCSKKEANKKNVGSYCITVLRMN